MTFRFNYTNFTANDAGRKLVCVSTTSSYFTVGKTYIIKMDGNSPCLITDDGQHLHATGSEFEFYHGQNLTPKQPKAGEVWCFSPQLGSDDYENPRALYHIRKVDKGLVYHQGCDDMDIVIDQPIEGFLKYHVFVF